METVSNAARVIVAIIPIVGIVVGAVVIFFWMFWRHRRIVLLIENDLYEKPSFDILSFSLLAGLLLSIVGVILTVFLAIALGVHYALLGGLIPLASGAALLAFYVIKRRQRGG